MFVSSALQYFHLYLHVKAFTKDMLFYWPWSEINAVDFLEEKVIQACYSFIC